MLTYTYYSITINVLVIFIIIMKKTVLIISLIVVAALIIFNLPKKNSNEKMAEKVVSTQSSSDKYVDYSKSSFDQISDKKRVYFFHAKWCPTCKVANEEFMQNVDKIPSEVSLFKTDYDGEKELKAQYGITYQHTFVYVDSQGKEIKKWNGGGIAELISNTIQ